MPSTLDLCEKFYGTRDIYALMEITKDSLEKDIKKAYYKLSLKVHPDRVDEEEKEIATEKFKVLAKIYAVLADKNKKALYDENGIIDDDDDEGKFKLTSWMELWKQIFKPITEEDIGNYEKEYVGSELERKDIKKAYMDCKGCINQMMNTIPFMSVEDEPRIQTIVKEMIDAGEVPEYKIFTNEPRAKRNRRHKKYAWEEKRAEKIRARLNKKEENGNLEQQIMHRQRNRESLLDQLVSKYENIEDEGESISLEDLGRAKKQSSSKKNTANREEVKSKEHRVRNGRVTKERTSNAQF